MLSQLDTLCYDYSQKLSGSLEIDLILHLNKLGSTKAFGNSMLDEMNIAGPSGTNKQLPKPPPPPGHSSAAGAFKERTTSLKYFRALFLSLGVYGLKVEWDPVTCVTEFPTVREVLCCCCCCLDVVMSIRGRVCFGISPLLTNTSVFLYKRILLYFERCSIDFYIRFLHKFTI